MGTSPTITALSAGSSGPDSRARYRRSWRVLHACDRIEQVLAVVEGQLAAGMRPAVVTLDGHGPLHLARQIVERAGSSSLLSAWGDVRSWRKSLLESGAESQFEVIHAHAFAPGMAAVRSCPTVVYDIHGFIEESAVAAHQCEERSWLARSFRVAEQFVLSRAAAVVVHSSAHRAGAAGRSAASEGIFLIPQPMDLDLVEGAEPHWRRRHGSAAEGSIAVLASAPDAAALSSMLDAFALVPPEAGIKLTIAYEGSPSLHHNVLSNRDVTVLIDPVQNKEAIAAADIVVAASAEAALSAMVHSKPVLAADTLALRDVSPDGRGCLWYRPGDLRDLAQRVVALASNAELRAALAAAGRKHLEETRSASAVGAAYDAVYRYASLRRRSISADPGMTLQPLRVSL